MAAHRMTTQLALMPKTPGSRLQFCLRLQSLCKATPSPAALALLALAAARPGRCLGLAVCWLICTQGRSTGTVGRGSTTTIALRQGRPATRPEFPQIPAQCKVLRTCDIGPVQRLIHLASALAALDGILRRRSKQGCAQQPVFLCQAGDMRQRKVPSSQSNMHQ